MLNNNSGIVKTVGGAPKQILASVSNQQSFGIVVDDDAYVEVGGKKLVLAGTPVAGSLLARNTPFTVAVGEPTAVKGVYTVQITTAFVADEVITIEGQAYTCKAAENVGAKQFAAGEGATAIATQITSLLKMVVCTDFDVAAAAGATDKLQFTQKVAHATNTPVVTKTSETGVIGDVTQTVEPAVSTSNNAVGVLLHDVDVTAGNNNGTFLAWGWVNINRLDASVVAMLTPACVAALNGKVTFVAG